jgi:hypothetical protein
LSLNSVQAQINKVDASGLGLNGVQQVAFASTKLMQARRKSDKSITSVKAKLMLVKLTINTIMKIKVLMQKQS